MVVAAASTALHRYLRQSSWDTPTSQETRLCTLRRRDAVPGKIIYLYIPVPYPTTSNNNNNDNNNTDHQNIV